MRMMSRTSSLNDKVIPVTEVKTTKNSNGQGMAQSATKSSSNFNFINSEKKNQQQQHKGLIPLKPAKGDRSDKLFQDDKSFATLKTESTNHSNGTASKGSSEKSSDESHFSSVFLSPRSRSRKRSVKRCQMNIQEIMTNRWINQLRKKIPTFDLEDAKLMNVIKADQRRQTAPEYSQLAYLSMIKKDKAIGNYFEKNSNLRIEPEDRESMVSLIQELHRVKEYSEETFYIAVCVADRYLSVLAERGQTAPNLIQLGTISLLLGAKLNQHMNPCFEMMIDKLPNLLRKQVNREQLIKLEEKIIKTLDFDLQHTTALPFLERYQRILKLDTEKDSNLHLKIGFSARKLLRHMMHKSQFLQYKSSQIAATAILVAIDLNKSEVEKQRRHYSQSPQKTVNSRKSNQSRFNTEKKGARAAELKDTDSLPVYSETKSKKSVGAQDFDDLLAMGDEIDLRQRSDQDSSATEDSIQQSEMDSTCN